MIRVGRKRDQRDLLVRSLATSVILYESIVTSGAKARMVQGVVDHLMTIAKSENKLVARRRLLGYLLDEKAVNKVLDELVTRLGDRTSGYTRRLRLQSRTGDGGDQALVQLVNTVLLDEKAAPKKADKKSEVEHTHEEKEESSDEQNVDEGSKDA